jgi:hemerythrin
MPTTPSVVPVDPLELEGQHAELRRRAVELVDARHHHAGDLGRHVEFLQEYAVSHFGAEEEHMRAAGYPGYVRHQAEHDRFLEDLLALSAEFERDGAQAFEALGAERWLGAWLERHVGGTDAEFTRWAEARAA